MLSPREQTALADIERQLASEEPRLARRLAAHRYLPGRRLAAVAGIAVLVIAGTGLVANISAALGVTILIVIGFALWLLSRLPPDRGEPPSD